MRFHLYIFISISFLFYSTALAHNTGHDLYYHVDNPSASISYSAAEIEYIKQKREIVMCTDPDWMPYEKFDSHDTYIGVSADYHKLLSHLTGLSYTMYRTKNWPETLEVAQEGKCDILSILNQTPERDKYLDFTVPYIKSPSVFVTRESDKFINGIDDLNGKTLAVVKGYMIDEIIKSKHPDINRIYADNIVQALNLVSRGKAFATAGSLLEMSYNIRQQGMLNLKITGDAKFGYELKVGVKKGEDILLSVLNKALSNITKEEKDQILNKWISIKYQSSYDYGLIIKILAGFTAVFLIILGKMILTGKYNKKLLALNNELESAKKTLEEVNKNLEEKVAEETLKRVGNERLLMQQSKLAAMGDMIGAIAHQWRQPLSAAGMLVQDIEDAYHSDTLTESLISENVEKTMKIILQMSDTINDFSNFLKPDKSKEHFVLCRAITEVASMFAPQLKNQEIKISLVCISKELDVHVSPDTYGFDCCENISVEGYPNEFRHVIMNIIKNAMDALNQQEISDKHIQIRLYIENERDCIIKIQDNAGGISDEIAPRIFEPYFSTKKDENGVGIGLYMTRQILINMDGDIWFENTEDGAAFFIKLQLTDKPAEGCD
ncbi:MAG: hypothetical protein C0602_04670 [Denitrovibrio sp.]|nr:MAG: hypothetical protein C0602_04670 [Denitrovibrio sp.]